MNRHTSTSWFLPARIHKASRKKEKKMYFVFHAHELISREEILCCCSKEFRKLNVAKTQLHAIGFR